VHHVGNQRLARLSARQRTKARCATQRSACAPQKAAGAAALLTGVAARDQRKGTLLIPTLSAGARRASRACASQLPSVPLPPPRVYASAVQTQMEPFRANLEAVNGSHCPMRPISINGFDALSPMQELSARRCRGDRNDAACQHAKAGRAERRRRRARCARRGETGSRVGDRTALPHRHIRLPGAALGVLLDLRAIVPDLRHAHRDPKLHARAVRRAAHRCFRHRGYGRHTAARRAGYGALPSSRSRNKNHETVCQGTVDSLC